MPHRFKRVDASDEADIWALIGSVDCSNPGDAPALEALQEIIEHPEASKLSPELLAAIRKAVAKCF